MIYRTRGEHANHYTTDAITFVHVFISIKTMIFFNACQVISILIFMNFSEIKAEMNIASSSYNIYII